MFRNRLVLTALAAVSLFTSMTALPALAVNVKKPDWVITLKTEEQKGVLRFKGSNVKDPVKVHVTYQKEDGPVDDTAVKYESFWYNAQGKPIGQEKFHEYEMSADQSIVIRVQPKNSDSLTEKESIAAAEAALRVYLDCGLHKGRVPAIRVPKDAFDEFEQGLLQQKFTKYTPAIEKSEQTQDKLILFVTSDPEGRDQYYRLDRR